MMPSSRVTAQRLPVLVMVLLLCAPNSVNVVAQAADFGFRFEVGPCLTERLDTFNGIFTKDLGGEPARTVTAHLALADAQMTAIYQTIENIRFFDYPSPFDGVPTGLLEVGHLHPSNTYRFEAHNGGSVHTVSWQDAFRPTTAEANRLRDFFSMVLGFIHEHPAFKQLPPPRAGCE